VPEKNSTVAVFTLDEHKSCGGKKEEEAWDK